mgnify:CR=1 FL=1|jgi:hypothetical protein
MKYFQCEVRSRENHQDVVWLPEKFAKKYAVLVFDRYEKDTNWIVTKVFDTPISEEEVVKLRDKYRSYDNNI